MSDRDTEARTLGTLAVGTTVLGTLAFAYSPLFLSALATADVVQLFGPIAGAGSAVLANIFTGRYEALRQKSLQAAESNSGFAIARAVAVAIEQLISECEVTSKEQAKWRAYWCGQLKAAIQSSNPHDLANVFGEQKLDEDAVFKLVAMPSDSQDIKAMLIESLKGRLNQWHKSEFEILQKIEQKEVATFADRVVRTVVDNLNSQVRSVLRQDTYRQSFIEFQSRSLTCLMELMREMINSIDGDRGVRKEIELTHKRIAVALVNQVRLGHRIDLLLLAKGMISLEENEELLAEKGRFLFGRDNFVEKLAVTVTSTPQHHALIAPAGTGKSAVVASLIYRLKSDRICVAYHFFSQVYRTDSIEACYKNLLIQIRALRGLNNQESRRFGTSADMMKESIAQELRSWNQSEYGKLVVLIDGLDEANEEFGSNEFRYFRRLADGVSVLISCRAGTVDETDESAPPNWLAPWYLGNQDRLIVLPALPPEGILDWMLSGFDGRLSGHANLSLARVLFAASDGLPLYLEYLLADAANKSDANEDVKAFFQQAPKGIESYVKQEAQLFNPNNYFEDHLLRILGLLTQTKAALPLRTILQVLEIDKMSIQINNASHLVQRWWRRIELSAEEHGFAFAHPRLRHAFSQVLDGRRFKVRLLGWMRANWSRGCDYSLRFLASHLCDELLDEHWPEAALSVEEELTRLLTDLNYLHLRLSKRWAYETIDDFRKAYEGTKSQQIFQFLRFLMQIRHRLETWPDRFYELALMQPVYSEIYKKAANTSHIELRSKSRFRWLAPESADESVLAFSGHVTDEQSLVTHLLLVDQTAMIVSASSDGAVLVHDTSSGRLLYTLSEHCESVSAMLLRKDGRILVTCGNDLAIRYWDLIVGYETMHFSLPTTVFNLVELDDERVVGGASGGLIEHVSMDKPRIVLLDGEPSLTCLCMCDVPYLAGGDSGGNIWLIDSKELKFVRKVAAHGVGVGRLVWNPVRSELWSYGYDLRFARWKIPSLELIEDLETALEEYAEPIDLVISADGQKAILCDNHGHFLVRDVGDQNDVHVHLFENESIGGSVLGSAPDTLIAVGATSLGAYSVDSGELFHRFRGQSGGFEKIVFSRDGHSFYTAGSDQLLKKWNYERQVHRSADPFGSSSALMVKFTADGDSYFVGRSWDELTINRWSDGSYRQIGGESACIQSFVRAEEYRLAFGSGFDGALRIWNIDSHKLLDTVQLEGETAELLYADRFNHIVIVQQDGTVYRMTPGKAPKKWLELDGVLTCAALSPSQQIMAFAKDDGLIEIVEFESGQRRLGIIGHFIGDDGREVSDIAFSPASDEVLASCGYDRKVKLWTSEGHLVASRNDHGTGVSAIRFDQAGERLYSVGDDETLRTWLTPNLEPDDVCLLPSKPNCLDVGPHNRIIVGCDDGLILRLHGSHG